MPILDSSNADPTRAMQANPIIADRAEFVDALRLLRKGHVLVKAGNSSCGCVLDGDIVYHSYDTLLRYGLIDEFDNPDGFPNVSYYRLSLRGRAFARRAVDAWQRKPVWQRLAMRLVG